MICAHSCEGAPPHACSVPLCRRDVWCGRGHRDFGVLLWLASVSRLCAGLAVTGRAYRGGDNSICMKTGGERGKKRGQHGTLEPTLEKNPQRAASFSTLSRPAIERLYNAADL